MEKRITVNPKILQGKPVIKGTRIPIYLILNLLGRGKLFPDILEEYPELKAADIQAAIRYAALRMKNEESHQLEASS